MRGEIQAHRTCDGRGFYMCKIFYLFFRISTRIIITQHLDFSFLSMFIRHFERNNFQLKITPCEIKYFDLAEFQLLTPALVDVATFLDKLSWYKCLIIVFPIEINIAKPSELCFR